MAIFLHELILIAHCEKDDDVHTAYHVEQSRHWKWIDFRLLL